ncbi:MAG: major facilitator superfamily domain-containing protein [Benniella sp.]|nr:MAG: major facilitator superfamily domain-containing protein [Benniella sp.]
MSSEKDSNTTTPVVAPIEQRDPLPFTAQGSNVVTVPSSDEQDKASRSLESSGGDLVKPEIIAATSAPTTFPEGGFGWMVVFGAFMIQFCGFGFNFCWGVYQEHYIQENIFAGATLSQVSWVGGIGASSVFITGPFQASMVRRFGLRPVIAAGALISATGMILASFAVSLWQLYLTQGFLFGLGAGMSIFTSIAVPAQWFEKNRGLATGITVAGSGIGGASLAPLNRFIISRVGYPWALRVMGIFSVVVIMAALVCIRERIPIDRRGGPIFDFSMLKDRGFSTMYFMGLLVTFGYLTPVFLLPKYVVDLGMEPKTGATLVGIFSGVNAASRILLGLAADKFGRLRVLFLCTATGGISCYALWLNTKGLTMAVIFVIVYGINGGGFVSLFPVVAAEIIGVEKLSLAVGLLYSGNLFGNLFGTPIASAIVTASAGSYTWAIIFAGTTPILGALLLLVHCFGSNRRT